MEHIKLFNTHTSYIEYASGGDMLRPNVIHCLEENEVHYRPSIEVEYLTFIPLEDGTFSFNKSGMQYSLDEGETWKTLEASTSTENVSVGTKVLWKASGLTITETEGIGRFSSSGQFDIRGNIMSLVNGDDFVDTNEISANQFRTIFSGTSVVDSSKLLLPSTTLTESCYRIMFAYCTSLTRTPRLIATTLAPNCYRSMFHGCESLIDAPQLPPTTLADYCYVNMFRECKSLTTAPELLATTLAQGCYASMFDTCTSLMVAPELPAMTLANNCYNKMFCDCTKLTIPPKLPSLEMKNSCYNSMFLRCVNLKVCPKLPAMTLAEKCYASMFEGCASITIAPDLLALVLSYDCYWLMFAECRNLSYVKMMATDISANGLDYWLRGVSQTGTFIKNSAATWTGNVPSGWKIETASS